MCVQQQHEAGWLLLAVKHVEDVCAGPDAAVPTVLARPLRALLSLSILTLHCR